MKIKLTKTESDILRHRLEIGDCIADALPEYHPEDVMDVAQLLLNRLTFDEINTSDADEIGVNMTKAVLADAVEGSTWIAASISEGVRPQTVGRYIAAGESLAKKIGEYVGRELRFPDR